VKVLFILSQFYPLEGGTERQALLLAKALSRKTLPVDVVTGRWSRTTAKRENLDSVKIYRNTTLGNHWQSSFMRNLSGVVYMVTLFIFLFLKRNRYNVYHVHQAFYPAFVAVIAGRLFKKPVIVKVGVGGNINDLMLMDEGRYFLGKWMASWIRKADCFIAISSQIKKELIHLGISEGKIALIPNGVEIPAEVKRDYGLHNPVKIIFVGRLNPEKGCNLLVKAVDGIREVFSIHLDIYGEGPLRGTLQSEIERRDLNHLITLRGYRKNIRGVLPEYDLFVLPSKAEGMSNALLEAMACGLPCVVSDISPNLELVGPGKVDGDLKPGGYLVLENGVAFHVNDSLGLANAIRFLIFDENARERLGKSAREVVIKRFSIEAVAQTYLELYGRLSRDN